MPDDPKQSQMTVKISDEMHRGVYSNRVIVAHSGEEFVLDFAVDLPPGSQIVARVITTPAHLAAFVEAIRENLARYEHQFGTIRRPTPPLPPGPAA